VAQGVEYLLCKHETLCSNPSPAKKPNQNKKHLGEDQKSKRFQQCDGCSKGLMRGFGGLGVVSGKSGCNPLRWLGT
jgi:hypothetical protein